MKPLILTEADFANLSLLGPHPKLQGVLKRATVVSSDAVPAERITMNTQVVLSDDRTGERRMVRLVYPRDANAARGQISVLEPLGAALLGASRGWVIECSFAGGPRCLRVEHLVYQPEHSLRTHLVTSGSPAGAS